MECIKTLRKKRNWTQYDLEFESGVSQAVISKIERGAKPTDKQRELILKAINNDRYKKVPVG